jgi:hypothetical protein
LFKKGFLADQLHFTLPLDGLAPHELDGRPCEALLRKANEGVVNKPLLKLNLFLTGTVSFIFEGFT